MVIRRYSPSDCGEILKLFYNTVHTVNSRDYTEGQLYAWATGEEDAEAWNRALSQSYALVATENGEIIGFGNICADGYLDRLYVAADAQGRGTGTALCDALESCASGRITVHASITARGFFLARGYREIRHQTVKRRGEELVNYVMEKTVRAQDALCDGDCTRKEEK